MAIPVVLGASIMCTMGQAPGSLLVTSQMKTLYNGQLVATIQDAAPMSNITPCGMCISMLNPAVASATTAALGVLTPLPCTPVPAGIWVGGSTKVLLGGIPSLTNDAKLMCAYGGSISISYQGQTKVMY